MKRSILIDANLLILLVVGSTRQDILRKHSTTKGYGPDDFHLLRDLLGRDPKIVLLPNVITEVSNLIGYYKEPDRSRIYGTLKAIIDYYSENYVTSRIAGSQSEYKRLGVTDATLLVSNVEDCVLLTDDRDLHGAAERRGQTSIYFTYEREANGLV